MKTLYALFPCIIAHSLFASDARTTAISDPLDIGWNTSLAHYTKDELTLFEQYTHSLQVKVQDTLESWTSKKTDFDKKVFDDLGASVMNLDQQLHGKRAPADATLQGTLGTLRTKIGKLQTEMGKYLDENPDTLVTDKEVTTVPPSAVTLQLVDIHHAIDLANTAFNNTVRAVVAPAEKTCRTALVSHLRQLSWLHRDASAEERSRIIGLVTTITRSLKDLDTARDGLHAGSSLLFADIPNVDDIEKTADELQEMTKPWGPFSFKKPTSITGTAQPLVQKEYTLEDLLRDFPNTNTKEDHKSADKKKASLDSQRTQPLIMPSPSRSSWERSTYPD